MENIEQVMPAGDWVAIEIASKPGGGETRREVPLVGWSLIRGRVVGLRAQGLGVAPVDESAENFRGYEIALGVRLRADIDEDDAQREWDSRFLVRD